MRKISALIISSGILSLLCLIMSYQAKWLISTSILLSLGIVLIFFRKHSTFWLPTIFFSTYSAIAIWFVMEQASPLLIFSGELFAFIFWELLVFRNGLQGNLEAQALNQLLDSHLRYLAPAMLLAWLLSIFFINIQFKLPFLVLLLVGSMGIYGFIRFYRIASKL